MKLTFRIEYRTAWGEELGVILDGNNSEPIILRTPNGEHWEGEAEMPDLPACVPVSYRYGVYRDGQCIRRESGTMAHLFCPGKKKNCHYILNDFWKDLPAESYLYSSAFSGDYQSETTIKVTASADGSITFRALCPCLHHKRQVLAISGDCPALGNWDIQKTVLMEEIQPNELYPAPVQFSAAKMQLEFLFGDRGRLAMDAYKANLKQTANQEVPKTFRKQELTEKSRLELEAGGTVKVSGLVDKKGKAYQGYITWKPGEKPAFMFPKDYKAALEEGCVKPAVENEVQVAVNSEGKTVEATRNLKEALQSAQQRPTGEQKQQQERRQEQKEDRKQAQKQEQPDKPKRSRGVRR